MDKNTNKALKVVKSNHPGLRTLSDMDIIQGIRTHAAAELYQELNNLGHTQTGGLGRIMSWWQRGKIEAQAKFEVVLDSKEKVILDRIQNRIAAQYGLTVTQLQYFLNLSFEAKVRNWEKEKEHDRQKDMLNHQHGLGLDRSYHDNELQKDFLTHQTSQEIRKMYAESDIRRREKREEIIAETVSFIVKVLAELGAEYARTEMQRTQLSNQIEFAAMAQAATSTLKAKRLFAEAREIKAVMDVTNDPIFKKMYKIRLEAILQELKDG